MTGIFSHDLLPCSPLFDGDLPTKPAKSALIAELEMNLADSDYDFPKTISDEHDYYNRFYVKSSPDT